MNLITDAVKENKLFNGLSCIQIESILKTSKYYTKKYKSGAQIINAGKKCSYTGIVISGNVCVQQYDVWGNRNIITKLTVGDMFGESFSFANNAVFLVDVEAADNCEILFADFNFFIKTSACTEYYKTFLQNLLNVFAQKNIHLTNKINQISHKSIRERVTAYLSAEYIKNEKNEFEIPFNRQQLADYLCVERSALSGELGKMRNDGLILFNKNKFTLLNIDTGV